MSVHPPFGSWVAGSGMAAVYIPFVPLDPSSPLPTPKIHTHTYKLTCSAVRDFITLVMSRATRPKLSVLDLETITRMSNFNGCNDTSSLLVRSDKVCSLLHPKLWRSNPSRSKSVEIQSESTCKKAEFHCQWTFATVALLPKEWISASALSWPSNLQWGPEGVGNRRPAVC